MKIIGVIVLLVSLSACTSDQQIENWVKNNPDKIMESLQRHAMEQRKRSSPNGDLIKQYSKEIFDDSSDPVAGNPQGSISIAYFFDFRCGHCAVQHKTIDKTIKNNKNIKVIYKTLPVLGPESEMAARGALSAHQQGKFLDFYRAVYKDRKITRQSLMTVAQSIGLDVKKWQKDLNSDAVNKELEKVQALASKLRISGTPFLAISPDKAFPGRVDQLEQVIQQM